MDNYKLLSLLVAAFLTPGFVKAQKCDASGGGASYTGKFKALGCYNDSSVSLLGDLKVSTVAMTPQYCADFCGARGYAYGGIIFTTQCFCDTEPNYNGNNKIPNSSCNSACVTAPEESCGGGYVSTLIHISNPQPKGSVSNAFKPACQLSPLCSLDICDTSLSTAQRVASLVKELTLEEKILNVVDAAAGSERIGLPSYEWWNEATHGVGSAPGVQFPDPPENYSYATSFPSPITSAAAFDIELIAAIGAVVGREGRAFGNGGYAGFDYWAPNMNPFRDPRWGRGQETPGEDILVVQNYVRSYVPGLQGSDPLDKQIIATCKHYAVYDLETGRYGNNYDPTRQDLADYFLAPFKTCVRDVGVGSVMCSYNAVLGYPSCSNPYLLEEVLRDHWNFTQEYHYVVGDCGAVADIHDFHNFTNTLTGAASVALNAGTDLDCGQTFIKLNESLAHHQITEDRLDEALTRLYNALFTVGYFDGSTQYGSLDFSDVGTPDAMQLAYTAAVEGMTLLKNDDVLPLSGKKKRKVALVGPYAKATTQMQGDYSGPPKKITSPFEAFNGYAAWDVTYALGTDIDTNDTSGFQEAVSAARNADIVIFLGGIDGSIESETLDRTTLTWPGNQLDLMSRLSEGAAPVIVVQFGGGQLDDSSLVKNDNVKGLIWAGYPSQDGGPALLDVMTGKQSIAGRLPITQYPASYADEVSIFDIDLRYNDTYPGRTYQWYTGKPIFSFGFGLHYTTFYFAWTKSLKKSYNIADLVHSCRTQSGFINDATPWTNVSVSVKNTGSSTSDYSGLLFLSSSDAGPTPQPLKTLISYNRLHSIGPGDSQTLNLPLSLGSIARADTNGDITIWPGTYKVVLDVDAGVLEGEFELKGDKVVIDTLPAPQATYDFAVPVHTQPPSYQAYS